MWINNHMLINVFHILKNGMKELLKYMLLYQPMESQIMKSKNGKSFRNKR